MNAPSVDVAVVGGGLVGSFVAWRAAQRGLRVTVVDDHRDARASWAAAGMLAPVSEYHPTEALLTAALNAAAGGYQATVDELEAATGSTCGYRATGTLVVGVHHDDVTAIAELHRLQKDAGVTSRPVGRTALAEIEPALGPAVRAGLFAADDHQVDPRRLLTTVIEAGARVGVARVDASVRSLDERLGDVVLADGASIVAGAVVIASGAWAATMPGIATLPVRPVKGQILRLRSVDHGFLAGPVIRGLVRGHDVYVVGRADGEIVIGATVEERGFDETPTAGALHALLRDARTLLPDLDEAVFVEHLVGFRPGTPDNGPLVGALGTIGATRVFAAVGHHRNGVLLAPLTGEAVAAQLTGDDPTGALAPFTPDRLEVCAPWN
jgi:glycine oxidase